MEAALGLLAEHGDEATVLAGGQSLLILLQQRLVTPSVVVGLRRVDGLDQVRLHGRLLVGAMATYARLAVDPLVARHAPLLARAAGEVGSVHIRNRGTVGGALCHADPAGDVATVALALGADIIAASRSGVARHRVDDFFTGLFETRLSGTGALLVDVEFDPRPDAATYGYRRHCHRPGEYPMCVAACRLEWDGDRCVAARVSLGGGGDRPVRLPELERVLAGQALTTVAVEHLLDGDGLGLEPPPDVRGGSRWKARVAERVLVAAVAEAVAERGSQEGGGV